MSKIIVFGSINMDLVIESSRMPNQGETVHGRRFFTNPGGKGANQAVAAARLGASVKMVGAVGQDDYGQQLLEGLAYYGVDTASIQSLPNVHSGVAVIILSKMDNRIIVSGGANQSDCWSTYESLLVQMIEPGDLLIAQLEMPLRSVIAAMQLAKKLGAKTILNPAPIPDELPVDLFGYIDYLILNEHEGYQLILHKGNVTKFEMLRKIKDLGPKHVIMTLGSEGSVTIINDKLYHEKSIDITVVDTTGAGDAYIGAFAVSLLQSDDLAVAMHLASQVAALAVSKEGAQQAMPTIDEWSRHFGVNR